MSVILTGNGNQIAMAAPGRPMLSGDIVRRCDPHRRHHPVRGPRPGRLVGRRRCQRHPRHGRHAVAAFGRRRGCRRQIRRRHRADRLSRGHHRHHAPIATPRLNGLLGGLGLNTVIPPTLPSSGQQLPLMDPDQGLISAAMAWVRHRLDAVSGLVAAELAAEFDCRQHAAEHRRHPGPRRRQQRRQRRWCCFPGTQQTVLTAR